MCTIDRAANKKVIHTSGGSVKIVSERKWSSAAPRDTPEMHLRVEQLSLETGRRPPAQPKL